MTDEEDHSSHQESHIDGYAIANGKKQPNVFVRALRSVFGYRKTSLSLFVFVTAFVSVLLSVVDNSVDYTFRLPSTKLERSLLDDAWLDLEVIGAKEHPYGSSVNDEVHDYLQDRINEIIEGIDFIAFDNDLNGTNKFMYQAVASTKAVSYYESNNLLVKIKGKSPSLPGFLLSAHYDSVPTSNGVTDDGMGIASMLAVLSYMSQQNQPERTMVFNFNNNEEFGLYGAEAFTHHPWFKQVKYFLNLEGTGAGGKAILFRGTDYGIVKYFKKVRYPYASSIFQQGFANGLVHSETDYKVYKEAGLRGLDLAFYKPRNIYHTAEDNVKNVPLRSLWHMLSNALDFSQFMADNEIDESGAAESAIYASLFNHFFAVCSSDLAKFNIALAVLFPILNGLLIFYTTKSRKWNITAVPTIVLPLALVLTVLVVYLVVTQGFRPVNQFLPTSSPGLLVATTTAISLLLFSVFSNIIVYLFNVPTADSKLVAIIEVSFIYWVALLFSTKGLLSDATAPSHTGEFYFSVLLLLEGTASFLGLLGWTFTRPQKHLLGEEEPLLNLSDDDDDNNNNNNRYVDEVEEQDEAHHHAKNPVKHIVQHFGYDWSLQYLLTVPVSFFLIYNAGWLILDGLNKTIQESALAESFVYSLIQAISIALMLPVLPFVYKLNRYMVLGLVAIAVLGSAIVCIKEPFNELNPLKLRFLQTVASDKSFVKVFGREGVLFDHISRLPSVRESGVKVSCSPAPDGNQVCSYRSENFPNIIPGGPAAPYIEIDTKKTTTTSTSTVKSSEFGINYDEIVIKAPKNRMCNLYFDNDDVKAVSIGGSRKDLLPFKQIPSGFSHAKNYYYKDVSGIRTLYLNKLDWDENYNVGFYWFPSINDESNLLSFKVECFWADLSPISRDGEVFEAIPAYEEVMKFTPHYVTWANRDRGLVSASKVVSL
ncbi:uncharacterized protein LODBEIA_P35100 [Lodderomyces beijingensis]|uniref:Peptide hydrolase n=1 Tax=Lodderomyces beijingensis TaxID=1775926 RepID=A0ABP0ZQT0_9ASCO